MKSSPLCCFLVFLLFFSCVYSQDNATTSAPPAPTTSSKSHISMKCTADYMEAKIDRKELSNLDTGNLHLKDESCKSTEVNDDFIIFRAPLDGCGTTSNASSDGNYLVYYNAITGDLVAPTTNTLITREHTAEMPFQCSYLRKVVVSRKAFTPRRAAIFTKTESFGNFTFTMDMYKTDEYKEKHEYPADIGIGTAMNIEVTVNGSDLAVIPVMCHATPTEGYDDKPQYVFINESCSQDDTLKYKKKEGGVQRFSLAAFRFLPNYDNVYLHCKVVACPFGESDSRCALGCKTSSGGSNRRRRAATLVRDIDQDLTLGPIKLRERQRSSAQTASSGSMITMVTIVAGVLGFLVVCLAVAIVIIYKRKKSHTNGAKLLVQEEA
ncbi:ZP domain-containing protein-like [Actinia tenebrosa]|uniref:ZP domain-containing protein-like n=1 Tax=Actinia tenebrosa TaxID=6105 RepID=A0A6P8IIX3_ACTTE|nr:ZP domain-containing protein-like [Actinia tenebrosa]